MIIETRYRDIPFEEARICATRESVAFTDEAASRKLWNEIRGRSVRIRPIPLGPQVLFHSCNGPWYAVNDDESLSMVCPHIAEIGD